MGKGRKKGVRPRARMGGGKADTGLAADNDDDDGDDGGSGGGDYVLYEDKRLSQRT